jgi:hypothetical protein
MVRQAIEDVVREQIGGGAEDGGCAGASASGGATSTDDSTSSSEGTSNCPSPNPTEDDEDGKPKSWLVVLAEGMARVATDHLHKMMDAQTEMENSGKESDEKKSSQMFTEAQSKFQAESKLFSMSIEATSTAIKAVGDGLASLARKQ